MAHAKLSPSSADRWMVCPGSVPLSEGIADESSPYADEGTAAHFLGSESMLQECLPSDHLGRLILVGTTPDGSDFATWEETAPADFTVRAKYRVDGEMASYVGEYVAAVEATL